jgi:hypothetical protein
VPSDYEADAKEKAQQVSIMNDIFASAQTALICMGPETPYTMLGLWLLEWLLRVLERIGTESIGFFDKSSLLSLASDRHCMEVTSQSSQNPWFSRLRFHYSSAPSNPTDTTTRHCNWSRLCLARAVLNTPMDFITDLSVRPATPACCASIPASNFAAFYSEN